MLLLLMGVAGAGLAVTGTVVAGRGGAKGEGPVSGARTPGSLMGVKEGGSIIGDKGAGSGLLWETRGRGPDAWVPYGEQRGVAWTPGSLMGKRGRDLGPLRVKRGVARTPGSLIGKRGRDLGHYGG